MKKFFGFLLPAFAVFFLFAGSTSAQNVQNFVIDDFSASYNLSKDSDGVGQLEVTETITAVFPNFNQNRGIERAIPKKYKDNSLKLQINGVKDSDGNPWNYTTRNVNDNLVLRIGDADKYVLGEQTYIISYKVSNVITFFDDHDELFWDINGDQWKQTFNNVSTSFTFDSSLSNSILPDKVCYTGSFGSTEKDCATNETNGVSGIIVDVATTKPLSPGETLSTAIGFQPGTFSKPPTDWFALISKLVIISLSILLPVATLIFVVHKWTKEGRDSKGRGIIIPEYKAPKGMNPVLAEMVLTEKTSPKSITAAVLELSVLGYLKIHSSEKKKLFGKSEEYEIELVKKPTGLSKEMDEVFSSLFSSTNPGEKLNITQQQNKLYSKMKSINTNAENNATALGYYLVTPTKARQRFMKFGILLFFASFGFFFLTIYFSQLLFLALLFGLSLSGIILVIASFVMPAKTAKGVAVKEQLLGLKDYMKLAEADRIKTLQSPQGAEKTPVDTKNKKEVLKIYEKLLPYAILFGLENEWAKVLAPLYEQSPEWFSGNNAFNAIMFSHAISGLQTSTAQSFSAPSSSGSSGFSGGGAGGGGGGGGGGGW